MACIGMFMCVYALLTKDFRGSIYFFAFFVVSAIMYLVRKRQRMNLEASSKQKEQTK